MSKVAIQLSGQQRYNQYFPQTVKLLHDTYGRENVDFFVHHWDGPRTEDQLRNLIPGVKALKTEPQIEFEPGPDWRLKIPMGSSIFSLMSMTYSIQEAMLLRAAYESEHDFEYDIVFRLRPDTLIVPITDQWHVLPSDPNTIRVGKRPHYLPPRQPEIQDQVAMGSSHAMKIYGNLYNDLSVFHELGNKFHPETYFYWYLKRSGLNYVEDGFDPKLEFIEKAREQRSVY